MGEVIKVDFSDKSNCGYILDGNKVDGIYHGELAAINDGGVCHIGKGCSGEILNPIEMYTEELNEFCIMWLAIFKPEVIKIDEQDND